MSISLPVNPVGIGFGVDIATPLPATRPKPGPGVIFGTLGKPALDTTENEIIRMIDIN